MEMIQEILIPALDQYGARLFWILVLFFIGRVLIHRVVHRLMHASVLTKKIDKSRKKRVETLCKVTARTARVVLYIIILIMVLSLFGVNTAPIITGAGIIGLAIGFGSQALVKDIVTGVFILAENQYGIGDKIKIGLAEGEVTKISIRSTVLKDEAGNCHYISNGSISNVINMSKTP
jgi:moderate conductance mechanosensitive channel